MHVREALGLRSASFTVTYENDAFTFATLGYGHGVGTVSYTHLTERRRKERKSMFFLMIGFIKWNVRGLETQCHSECGLSLIHI